MARIYRFLFTLFFLSACGSPQTDFSEEEYPQVDSLQLIPWPLELEKREGYFSIDSRTSFVSSSDLQNESDYLKKLIDQHLDNSQKKSSSGVSTEIELKLVNDFPDKLQNGEAYRLIIAPEKLQVTALTSTGIMRGIQTMQQLFVPAFSLGEKRYQWYLPCLKIEDKPAFEHRGLLLDVCRHFFDKEVVLKYLDMMSYYKMNILHLHLTEDQGWRLPVEQYPLLNTISSYRTEKDGQIYGGCYSKEELKDIVAYAQERHIVVIPEIELPGHSQAALAAYPQYSCSGGPIEVANDWGVFKEIYCAGNDSTFVFLENILTEVMEIFPSEYIHIGGDEAPKYRWEHCIKCQKRMKDENLKDEHELQSYFIRRIEKFLNENGRKLIGWDEILEGGLSENATVQSWRGLDGGLEAALQKHYVIMSPTSHCYLDYGLDAIDLKKIYSFNPVPGELPADLKKYILGGECNMWTEHVPDEAILDSKVFPRMIALAEVLWSGPDTNRYASFYQRLQKHYSILESKGIQYGAEAIPFRVQSQKTENSFKIVLENIQPGLTVKYQRINKDESWQEYLAPIEFDFTGKVVFQAFKNDKTYGFADTVSLANHLALFKSVIYENPWNDWYAAGGKQALVDGQLGSYNFRDGNWQGFWGKDLEVVIDLDAPTEVKRLTLNSLEYSNAWIMRPQSVFITYSDDEKKFTPVKDLRVIPVNAAKRDGIEVTPYLCEFSPVHCRYLKIVAKNYGKLPPTHEAAGQDAWLFVDEIIVE